MAADGRTAAGNAFPENRERASGPGWHQPLMVWVQSEFLQTDNYFRFGGQSPEYEGASWPLGAHADRLVESNILDGEFNRRVLGAWQLPWHYSHLLIETAPRRASANFLIRNVGHWHKSPERYRALASLISSRNIASALPNSAKRTYALTPFCLISQYWLDALAPNKPSSSIAYTDILLFYTFETFVQECLAQAAFAKNVPPAQIVGAYDHVYCNARPTSDAVTSDLAALRLAPIADLHLDWNDLRTTIQNAALPWLPAPSAVDHFRAIRETLFELRLGLHLMVAIAAACCGLTAIRDASKPCPLVKSFEAPPELDQLAGHWLGHALGTYDHAAACQQLLTMLAHRHGVELAQGPKGLDRVMLPRFEGPEPQFTSPRTAVEREIATTALRVSRERGRREAFDRFRWRLFEPSLVDSSIQRWSGWFGSANASMT